MLGTGLGFGRVRGEDRFYNPAKARRSYQKQQTDQLRRAQSDYTGLGSTDPPKPVLVPVSEPVVSPLSNLERFLDSVIPSVPALYLSKRTMRGWRTYDGEFQPYFVLGDLWESFKEWSAYGAGVPLILNVCDSVVQYYVPYLSGIQIYVDSVKLSAKSRENSSRCDGCCENKQ
ncbi:hypothetical protein GOBAR_AA33460 [Gossypium barbadense]|uniref:DUF789 domain-containing protein n=1 Tax=Gossypium barbadense TaxID=3634 RepID=A0A2P5W834_GOSBA|nr:hypothetical protein GOBAR_AA33460 [Gossypium barbadense]